MSRTMPISMVAALSVTGRAMSMGGLADRLSGPVFNLERPVVDMTGIEGVYDFTLTWAPDDAPLDGLPSGFIFTPLQEQLGLKLEAQKIMLKILVVRQRGESPCNGPQGYCFDNSADFEKRSSQPHCGEKLWRKGNEHGEHRYGCRLDAMRTN